MNTGKGNKAASTDRSTGVFSRITMREIMGIMAFLTPSGLVPPYVTDICIEEEKSGVQESHKLEEAVAVSVVSEYAAKCTGLPKKAR
ncbi:hypothetical protein [Anaplasma bovis]|uniref:hypothetical protein n=1 Tax=Anaplasma bovis TaxID=186733 RepID=UPI002FF0DD67